MRQSPNPRNHAIREFILGAILILAIQLIVVILSIGLIFGMSGIINTFNIATPDASLIAIAGSLFIFMGITQIAYLAPVTRIFCPARTAGSQQRHSPRRDRHFFAK